MTTVDPLTLLRLHLSTRGLTGAQIGWIAKYAEVVRYEQGDIVQHAHQPLDYLYLVSAGRLRLAFVLPGNVEKTFAYAGRDDQLGVLTLLQDEPSLITAVAEQSSVLLRIPRHQAFALLRDLPLWNRNLLKALGPKLRNAFLGGERKQQKRVIVLIHLLEQSRDFAVLLAQQLTSLGEKVGLASDRRDTLALQTTHSMLLLDSDGSVLPVSTVRETLGTWSDADRVILDCHINTASSYLSDLMVASEATYFLCSADTTRHVVAALQPLLERSPGLREKIFAIRVLDPHEQVAPPAPQLKDVCYGDFKLHWNGCDADSRVCTQQAGLQRILHHLRGVSVGLALGGGAARGMAHLGVLQVIEESGITIDGMSGTSAGALVGIPFAAGYPADFVAGAFATDLKPGWLYRMLPYGDVIYALWKYRSGGWDPMLRKYLHDWKLDQLTLPFSSVTVDLVAAEQVVRRDTDATMAILESINLPGIARPICSDGRTLVDGGILDVVPADVVVSQGANLVISSDVSSRIAFEFCGNRPGTPTERMNRPGGIAGLVRSRTVQDRNIRTIGGSAADIVIEPDVSTVDVADFKRAVRIAEYGRAAAEAALPDIKRALHELDPPLFPL